MLCRPAHARLTSEAYGLDAEIWVRRGAEAGLGQAGTTAAQDWYHLSMAMNLRLRHEASAALRAESERTGVSQQEILRRAVDEHLGLVPRTRAPEWPDWVEPPAEPYRDVKPWITPPPGRSMVDVLSDLREERLY
jgi:hypothetical protein